MAQADARLLILGSMPGIASLEAGQYYAFPRNVFWKIMGELFAFDPTLDYAMRCHRLTTNKIALWDVLKSCHRPGSLDAAISDTGLKINDFGRFFQHHPHIRHIYFNGKKAASLFSKMVVPHLSHQTSFCTLPSTSPAHAAQSYGAKLNAWSIVKSQARDPLQGWG